MSFATISLLYLADHDALASAKRHTCSAWEKEPVAGVRKGNPCGTLPFLPTNWQWETHPRQLSPEISAFSLNPSCHHVVGANKDKGSFGLPKCGLLTKCQYCTRLCILWCLLVNCPSGGKWLLYTVALTLGTTLIFCVL